MTQNVIKIHADELTYTPTGLRTPSPLELKVGTHNTVVLKRPTRAKAVPAGLGGFGFDSSFPSPVALVALLAPSYQQLFADIFGSSESVYYQFFGHAQAEGKEAQNKALSERRAAALSAILVGDPEQLNELAVSDAWGDAEAQTILRVLRCDPGVIDGKLGEVTEVAVRVFQEEYVESVFHRHVDGVDPENPSLQADGVLGPKTKSALVESYALACSPQVPKEQLHPSHAIVGCTEFNQIEDPPSRPQLNRRVALVIHDVLPPFHENAPCTVGDHSVCPTTDAGPTRCVWYQAHVEDPTVEDLVHMHFDLRWLALPNGKILLSALTTLADDAPVSFQVFSSKPATGPQEIALGKALSEPMSGIVRLGVAQVVWDPPDGFELLDLNSWLLPVKHTSAREIWNGARKRQPPIFTVDGGGVQTVSPPPGDDFGRVVSRHSESQGREPKFVIGIDAFGRHYQHEIDRGRPELSYGALLADETRVVAVRFVDGRTEQEQDQ